MNVKRIALIVAALIAVLAVIGWIARKPGAKDTDILVSPRIGDFEVIVTTTGELKAKRSTKIYGPRGARKAGIWQVKINDLIPEGSVVKEGDYVAALDKSELNSKVQEEGIAMEKAMAEFTEAKLDTALKLSEARNDIVNFHFAMKEKLAEMEQSAFEAPATQQKVKLEYEKTERSYEQSKSNYLKRVAQAVAQVRTKQLDYNKRQNKYNELRDLLDGFTVMAPADGMVIYAREWDGRKKTTGTMIQMWNPVVATLPDLTEMQSVTYVNEVDIQKLKSGQKVRIGLDAMAGKELAGEVTEVANIGEQRPNSDSKVFEVTITISTKDTTLRPAMTTSNEIEVAKTKNVLHIPLECLHTQDSVSFVFVKEAGKLVKQEVETGLINENEAEIKDGLTEDDRLFLSLPADTTRLPLKPLP